METKDQKFVICLGREYGSGGHNIGKALSKMLGIEYYDKKLLDEAAKNSGISQEYFARSDEKAPGSFSHTLSSGLFAAGGIFMYSNSLSSENIFKYQSEAIREIASRTSCIIVGRCADYVLREQENVFSVFITAPMEQRAQRVARREGISLSEAQEKAKKMDKARKEYYNYFTNQRWGHTDSYQLCIDSSLLGEEGTAAFIRDFVREALEKKSDK